MIKVHAPALLVAAIALAFSSAAAEEEPALPETPQAWRAGPASSPRAAAQALSSTTATKATPPRRRRVAACSNTTAGGERCV